MTKVAKLIFPAILLGACAQPADPTGAEPLQQMRSASVDAAEHHDSSPPLFLMRLPDRDTNPEHEVKPVPRRYQPGSRTHAPTIQTTAPSLAAPAAGLSFDGVGNGFTGPSGTFSVGAAPPDTNGDVGPNHYVQTVNTDFAVFNKSGTSLYGPVPINTLWSGFGGGCQTNNDGDPLVVYDSIADRWVISQFSVTTTPYLQCIAVSQTGDPTGSYYRYSFSYGTGFNDYPKMGVWPDGYYFTYNIFTNGQAFAGAKVCAMDRSSMLSGAAATQQCFDTSTSYGGLLPADLDGARQPPTGEPNFILGLGTTSTALALWKFHVDWATPANSTFTGPATLTVASYAEACSGGTCIPQAGTTQQLDSLADRMMYRLQYRNFGDHESLVTNHSVTAGSSTGVRWYEIRSPNGTPAVYQQGTFAPDANYRWMGSAAMDGSGGIALAYSVSSSSTHPALQYTGRNAGDALGTMTAGEGVLIAGGGSQLANLSRWGDYSNVSVDPTDDCTFWFTSEYIPANGTFNWRTRIGSFKLSGCGAPPPPPPADTTPPTTAITAPANGATVSGTTTVTATASDNVGVTKVEIYLDSTLAISCPSSPCSYAWNTAAATNASHTLGSKAYDAAGNVGTSANVTVTVNNATSTCATRSQLLGNPGFESGATTWTQTPGVIDGTTAGSAPRTGSWKAWLDGYGTTHTDDLYQTVTIPAGACTASLSFWLKITTAETTTTTAYDKLTVTVRSSAGTVLATLGTYSNLNSGTSYLQKTFDLAAYKGQTVRIQFHGTEDSSLQTSFFIDDTSLTVTQ